MEKKKQNSLFSSLKQEISLGLSPRQPPRERESSAGPPEMSSFFRSASLRSSHGLELLSPLREGPDTSGSGREVDPRGDKWAHWLCRVPAGEPGSGSVQSGSDLKLLLGVMGAPLAPSSADEPPSPNLCAKDAPIESSSAQYILQQYLAASGGQKLIQNAYTMGKVRMAAYDIETATRVIKNKNTSKATESGSFVLWQKNPDMWYIELALGGSKIHAGCNGKLVWRHTPWVGAHAAKGPVRPLRRALQGLDPRTTANMFSQAKCTGEKNINGEDCFILKINADPHTLRARSEGPAEIVRHVLFGCFSQKTGLLVHLEDSHLTRIQTTGGDYVYWETTINSFLEDYRPVEGIMIAHSGKSVVTLYKFGETSMSHTKTRMEESWSIEEVVFNVPGLSVDCFIPPGELRLSSVGEVGELPQAKSVGRSKVVALGKSQDSNGDSVVVKMNMLDLR